MTLRQKARRLVNEIPARDLRAACGILERLRDGAADPLLKLLLAAPEDDEPITPEEEKAVAEARDDIEHGRLIPMEEVRRRLLGRPSGRRRAHRAK